MRRRTASMFLVPLAVVGLVATGCGGSSKESTTADTAKASNSDVAAILGGIKAADQTKPASISMDLGMTLDGAISDPRAAAIIGSGPIALKFDGKMDPTAKAADLTFDVRAGKISLPGKLRLLNATTGFIGLNDNWYEIPAKSLTSGTAKTASDPGKTLTALGNPAELLDNAKVVGAEEIGGIMSDHITGDINVEGLARAMERVSANSGDKADPASTDKAVKQLKDALKSGKVDLWVGQQDKQMHKLSMDATVVFPADALKQTMGVKGAGIKLSIQSVPVASVNVEKPAGAKSSAQLQNDLITILMANLGAGTTTTP